MDVKESLNLYAPPPRRLCKLQAIDLCKVQKEVLIESSGCKTMRVSKLIIKLHFKYKNNDLHVPLVPLQSGVKGIDQF